MGGARRCESHREDTRGRALQREHHGYSLPGRSARAECAGARAGGLSGSAQAWLSGPTRSAAWRSWEALWFAALRVCCATKSGSASTPPGTKRTITHNTIRRASATIAPLHASHCTPCATDPRDGCQAHFREAVRARVRSSCHGATQRCTPNVTVAHASDASAAGPFATARGTNRASRVRRQSSTGARASSVARLSSWFC